MRVLVAADELTDKHPLVESLKRKRECTNVDEVNTEHAMDSVIRLQPDLVVIALEDESLPQYHALVREIHDIAMGRIVVVGPAAEAKALLKFLQEGAFQYIDRAEFDSDFESLLKKIRGETMPVSQLGRAIGIVGAGGGSGASTLAVNMAASLARDGKDVALMDLSLESGDLATLLNLRPKYSISDFCRNADRMDKQMFENCMVSHSSGMHVLAAPNSIADIKFVTPRGVRRLLHMARMRFPYVIIDIGQPFREEHRMAAQQCDAVILALRLEFSSLHHAARAMNFLGDANIPKAKINPVINRYRRRSGVSVRDVEKTLGIPVSHILPDDPRRISVCNDRGTPVVIKKRRSAVAKRLSLLAHSFNGAPPKSNPAENDLL